MFFWVERYAHRHKCSIQPSHLHYKVRLNFQIEEVTVYFLYEHVYPEQYGYMVEMKRALDACWHALLEMLTGTGKTSALLSFILSYSLHHFLHSPPLKLLYCTCTLQSLSALGRDRGWFPYFLSCHMICFASVVVYSYQYLLDPKVATIISREMQCKCVVVFDKAHNIDNICIEALSISVRKQTLGGATRNLSQMAQEIDRLKAADANRLRAEYNRLVDGLAQRGNLPITDAWFSNPALPDDILKEAVPGNIRRAEHFLSVLRRLVQYLKGRLQTENVETEWPVAFVSSVNSQAGIDQKMLRFCYDRLHSLMRAYSRDNRYR